MDGPKSCMDQDTCISNVSNLELKLYSTDSTDKLLAVPSAN